MPLAAVENAMAHCREQPGRARDLASSNGLAQQCVQQGRDFIRPLVQARRKITHAFNLPGHSLHRCRSRRSSARRASRRTVARTGCYANGAAMGKGRTSTRTEAQGGGHDLAQVRPTRGDAEERFRRCPAVRFAGGYPGGAMLVALIAMAMVPAVLGVLYRVETNPAGFDPDARALAAAAAGRAAMGGDRGRRARSAAIDHHVGRRSVLQSSRRRPARTQRGDRRCHGGRKDARRQHDHHAARQEPVPVERAFDSCARPPKFRWPCISTSSCRRSASWRSTSTSPNGTLAFSASRPRRSTISAGPPPN